MKKYISLTTFFIVLIFLFMSKQNKDIITLKNDIKNKDSYNFNNYDINYLKKEYNKDIIGIINKTIMVVQTSDNDYYLNHNLNKKKDKYGTVFMDYRCSIDDQILIFYGHNSKLINTDFHFLEKYLDKDYLEKNPYISFKTLNYEKKYHVFSIFLTSDNEHTKLGFNNKDNYLDHLNSLKKRSIYEIESNLNFLSNIIILQTCNMQKENEYIIVAAYEVNW